MSLQSENMAFLISAADLHHFHTDPDPSYHLVADLDPAFHASN
jgi:hypothetical protein